jgi:hypothetical protein
MTVSRHWLAPRKDGSWDVIDSEAVARAYVAEGAVNVEGPYVPANQLTGAVDALAQVAAILSLGDAVDAAMAQQIRDVVADALINVVRPA